LNQYDAVLSVGTKAQPALPWTVINSNGWLARVSSGRTDLPSDCSLANPISSLAAASLGVSEVFKRLLRIKEERGRFFDNLTFSLFTYKTDDSDIGPPLPESIQLESALLVGVGAIGNGIVHLLNQLPVQGSLMILDIQVFQPENLGTCLLIGPSEIGKEKSLFAEELLKGKMAAKGYNEDLFSFKAKLGAALPYPSVILNALDNIPARHASQDIWPDVIIDGAISDFACQVSRHPWGEDIACLKCVFREAARSAEKDASTATGLREDRVRQAFEVVDEQDILLAPAEKKDWLREHLGQKLCSVIQDGVAQQISKDKQNALFEPSVPFVACLSASMVIAELVKSAAGWKSSLEPRFQFDVLRGPDYGQPFPQSRRRDCICVERESNINKIKLRRSGKKRA
jgi:molybdopterin/thiamine biosynthesis adenylyltransferase